jgi:uncharacterized protein YkwD
MPRTPAQAVGFLLGFWLAIALSPLMVKTAAGEEPASLSALEAQLYDEVNRIRDERHLIRLERLGDLDRVALAHSRDMAKRGFFSHHSPEGASPLDRLQDAGIVGMRLAAENLGKTSEENPSLRIVEHWLDSADHRRNLHAPAFNLTGIGVVRDATGALLYTQVYVSVPR